MIMEAGLGNYYRFRETAEDYSLYTPGSLNKLACDNDYGHMDHAKINKFFVTECSDDLFEASLIISGIRCAACVWLLENYLGRQVGVKDVHVNLANQRAFIQFAPEVIPVSQLFRLIDQLGYEAAPYKPSAVRVVYQEDKKRHLKGLGIAGIVLMQVMMLSFAMYSGAFAGMAQTYEVLFRYASMILVTPVVFYSAWPFFSGAYRDLIAGIPGMDLPVSIAISSAYTFSAWHTLTSMKEVYFDSVSMFVFFLLLGRYLEFQARYHSLRTTNDLLSVFPAHAFVVAPDGSDTGIDERMVLVEELEPGDQIRVGTGEIIPADGILLDGEALVDQSALSGESTPISILQNSQVFAGAINLENPIRVNVTATAGDAVVSRVVRLSERAAREKPYVATIADAVARRFVVFVIVVASLTALWWGVTDPSNGFSVVLSVLVISCPCALSLATPAALTVATSALGRIGFLVSKAHVLERLASVKDVVFDKTGTLTQGKLAVEEVIALADLNESECLDIAGALEKGVEHPVASAFSGSTRHAVDNREQVIGQGVSGTINDLQFRIGKPAFACPNATPSAPKQAGIWILLSRQSGPVAWFRVTDQMRDDSIAGVRHLDDLGVSVHLITGDSRRTAEEVGKKLAIRAVHSEISPEHKMHFIKSLQESRPEVIMVGDGINDIAALSLATTSIAMADASDFVQAQADAVLLSNRVNDIARAVEFGRKTRRIIRQNLAWALSYNIVALPLAVTGMVVPWLAALGMSCSSLIVVGNAWRLSRVKIQGNPD
jgi:Cu2+-exporting ATPase